MIFAALGKHGEMSVPTFYPFLGSEDYYSRHLRNIEGFVSCESMEGSVTTLLERASVKFGLPKASGTTFFDTISLTTILVSHEYKRGLSATRHAARDIMMFSSINKALQETHRSRDRGSFWIIACLLQMCIDPKQVLSILSSCDYFSSGEWLVFLSAIPCDLRHDVIDEIKPTFSDDELYTFLSAIAKTPLLPESTVGALSRWGFRKSVNLILENLTEEDDYKVETFRPILPERNRELPYVRGLSLLVGKDCVSDSEIDDSDRLTILRMNRIFRHALIVKESPLVYCPSFFIGYLKEQNETSRNYHNEIETFLKNSFTKIILHNSSMMSFVRELHSKVSYHSRRVDRVREIATGLGALLCCPLLSGAMVRDFFAYLYGDAYLLSRLSETSITKENKDGEVPIDRWITLTDAKAFLLFLRSSERTSCLGHWLGSQGIGLRLPAIAKKEHHRVVRWLLSSKSTAGLKYVNSWLSEA